MNGREGRRETDHSFHDCPMYQDHETLMAMNEKLDRLSRSVEDIVSAYQSAQGFIKVVTVIGTILKWIASLGLAIGTIWGGLWYIFGK